MIIPWAEHRAANHGLSLRIRKDKGTGRNVGENGRGAGKASAKTQQQPAVWRDTVNSVGEAAIITSKLTLCPKGRLKRPGELGILAEWPAKTQTFQADNFSESSKSAKLMSLQSQVKLSLPANKNHLGLLSGLCKERFITAVNQGLTTAQ